MSSTEYNEQEVFERSTELYNKYQSVMDSIVPLFNKRHHIRKFSSIDAYSLGMILENFETWRASVPEDLVIDYLGKLKDPLTVLATAYATSIMPSISSIQPLVSELGGVVYYHSGGKIFSTEVSPESFPIKGNWGTPTEFVLGRGRYSEEEYAADLISEINYISSTNALKKIVDECKLSVTWHTTSSKGMTDFEHKLSFVDAIIDADDLMKNVAGRGAINFMIASSSPGLVLLATQPGFHKLPTGTSIGPQIYGVLNDSILIIKSPGLDPVSSNTIYCGYRGSHLCEAPIVYSPYTYMMAFKSDPHVAQLANVSVVNHEFLVKIVLEP